MPKSVGGLGGFDGLTNGSKPATRCGGLVTSYREVTTNHPTAAVARKKSKQRKPTSDPRALWVFYCPSEREVREVEEMEAEAERAVTTRTDCSLRSTGSRGVDCPL